MSADQFEGEVVGELVSPADEWGFESPYGAEARSVLGESEGWGEDLAAFSESSEFLRAPGGDETFDAEGFEPQIFLAAAPSGQSQESAGYGYEGYGGPMVEGEALGGRPKTGTPEWTTWYRRQASSLARKDTIVIADADRVTRANQIKEGDFLAVLALELAKQISRAGRTSPVQLPVEPFEKSLRFFLDVLVGRGNLHAWINRRVYRKDGRRLREPLDGRNTIGVLVGRFRRMLKTYSAIRQEAVPPAVAPRRGPAARIPASAPPGVIRMAQELEDGNISGPTSRLGIGNEVHKLLQRRYIETHVNSCTIIEARITGPCAGSKGETLRVGARNQPDPEKAVWAMALATGHYSQRRGDVIDVTTREVWEIKPVSQVAQGIKELYGYYLNPVNTTIRAFNVGRRNPLKEYRPGISWKPDGMYVVPPGISVIVQSVLPGIIQYRVVDNPTIPVPQMRPVRSSVRERKTGQSGSSAWWAVPAIAAGIAIVVIAGPELALLGALATAF